MDRWFYVEHMKEMAGTRRLVFRGRRGACDYVRDQLHGRLAPPVKINLCAFLEGKTNSLRIRTGSWLCNHDFQIYPLTDPPYE